MQLKTLLRAERFWMPPLGHILVGFASLADSPGFGIS